MITIKLITLITIIITIMLIVIINKNVDGGGKYVSTFQGILIIHLGRHVCLPISDCNICRSVIILIICYVIFLGRHACLPISNCYICRFVMSFLMRFPHENDTVYLAHCYPYRYSGSTIMMMSVMMRVI